MLTTFKRRAGIFGKIEKYISHLEEIAKVPHPVESIENQKVRDYIISEIQSMGLDVGIQRKFSQSWAIPLTILALALTIFLIKLGINKNIINIRRLSIRLIEK